MKIGYQTSRYNNLTFKQEITEIENQKIKFFDVFFDEWKPDILTMEEKDKIIEMKNNGLTYTIHLPIADYSVYKSEFDVYIDFINLIKPYSVTIHFNKLSFETIETLLKRLDSNIYLSIENTIPDFNNLYNLDYIKFMKKVITKFNVYSTFDVGHCFINKNNPKDYLNKLIKLGIKISTFHIHDNDGFKDNHMPIGEGIIDYNEFINEYKKLKLDCVFIIEHWTNNKITLKKLEDFLHDGLVINH